MEYPALLFFRLWDYRIGNFDLCFHWNSTGALNMKTCVCALSCFSRVDSATLWTAACPRGLIYLQIFSDSLLSQLLAPPSLFSLYKNCTQILRKAASCFNLAISRKYPHHQFSLITTGPTKEMVNQQVKWQKSIWFSTQKGKEGQYSPREIKTKFESNLCIYVA